MWKIVPTERTKKISEAQSKIYELAEDLQEQHQAQLCQLMEKVTLNTADVDELLKSVQVNP